MQDCRSSVCCPYLFTQARLGLSARLARIRFHVRPKQDAAGIANERRHETRLWLGPSSVVLEYWIDGEATAKTGVSLMAPLEQGLGVKRSWLKSPLAHVTPREAILLAMLPKTRVGCSGAASGWVCHEYNCSLLYSVHGCVEVISAVFSS